jgi:hypothetical protein
LGLLPRAFLSLSFDASIAFSGVRRSCATEEK